MSAFIGASLAPTLLTPRNACTLHAQQVAQPCHHYVTLVHVPAQPAAPCPLIFPCVLSSAVGSCYNQEQSTCLWLMPCPARFAGGMQGEVSAPIGRLPYPDVRGGLFAACAAGSSGAKPALSRFRVVRRDAAAQQTVVEVEIFTGGWWVDPLQRAGGWWAHCSWVELVGSGIFTGG